MPSTWALGTALQQQVPNPFLGTPLGVGILSGPTVQRGQLLRPYPQFADVQMIRPDVGRSRYNAVVLSAGRRMGDGWSAQASYTWSRLEDNQWGESNFFSGSSSNL